MEHYFVILEIPGGDELKFSKNSSSTAEFWDMAADVISRGEAQIISKRRDTGVCEELRKHLRNIKKFTTFVLVHMQFCPGDLSNDKFIFNKLSRYITGSAKGVVIDRAHNFQLVTIDM